MNCRTGIKIVSALASVCVSFLLDWDKRDEKCCCLDMLINKARNRSQ